MSETFNFDDAMKRLNEIANDLEKDTLGLDDAIKLFEEGLKLSRKCQNQLEFYEKKVSDLVTKHQGESIESTD